MSMEYTHDKHCDALITLEACNIRSGTTAGRPRTLQPPRNEDVIIWAGIVWYIVVGPYPLSDTMTKQLHCDFWDVFKDAFFQLRGRGRGYRALWGRCPALVERDVSRKLDWAWRVAGSNPGGIFPVWTPEGTRLLCVSRDDRRSRW